MREASNRQTTEFGGPWTRTKLEILERYLDAYTNALKNTSFCLVYIDAFAGSGKIQASAEDRHAREFLSGSAERAVRVDDRKFDRLIFVDKSPTSCRALESLRRDAPDRDIVIKQQDANRLICSLDLDWRMWRGVIFLDPFATQVDWATIECIAEFEALDMWLLFPTHAIVRLLPRSSEPRCIDPRWHDCLNRVYGDDSWRGGLYEESKQLNFWNRRPEFGRERGVDGLLNIYKKKLKRTFGKRFLENSRPLKNSTGGHLFELISCVGHPHGIGPARRIAGHLLDRI